MRPFSLLAFCLAVLCSGVASAQLFPNAPWNKPASNCYIDAAGNQVCQSVDTISVPQTRVYYPSVSSTTTYSYPTVSYGSSGGAVVSSAAVPGNAVSILRRSDFRKSLMAAAKAARENGEISVAQYFKIAAMSRVPRVAENLKAAIHEAAIEEGIATAESIDWDAIIAFIEKLIPLIIQLIDLFSYNDALSKEIQYAVMPDSLNWAKLETLA